MNSCANKVLEEDWAGAKDKVILFLNLIDEINPGIKFYYPLVIRGVCELQLKEFVNARRTFLQATENQDGESNPLIGLGFAGLGHTYFSLESYDKSLKAFQKALSFLSDDEYIQFNHLGALIYAGEIDVDEKIFEKFDLSKLSPQESLKVINLKGIANYKKGKYDEAIQIFGNLRWDDLDETSALYYSMALRETGSEEKAIDILNFAANKLKTANIYHHLADIFLGVGYVHEAILIYENFLCNPENPNWWCRQFFIEYARILTYIDQVANHSKICEACEKVLDLGLFKPPQSKEDYFYLGYANYLLGKDDLAEYEYQRSAGFCEMYYNEIVL